MQQSAEAGSKGKRAREGGGGHGAQPRRGGGDVAACWSRAWEQQRQQVWGTGRGQAFL
jgi:hypothetical protein